MEEYIMDFETMSIQLEQDFNELAEQYDGAADNELMFALGAPTAEATKMHTENVVQNRETAKLYRELAKHASEIVKNYLEV
jgi:hypothetical protein